MEDDGFEEALSSPETKPKAKAKRKLTEAQLEQLAKACAKANTVRKQNAETRRRLKEKQKQLADMKR